MKKITILALICFFGLTQMSAQVTFRPGLRTGLNFSNITRTDSSTRTDFYFGGFGALKLTKYYTLQPEITYTKQGGNDLMVSYYDYNTDSEVIEKKDVSVSYVSIGLINKFTFNDKFNFHFGHTFDIQAGQSYYTYSEVDITFMAGLGYDINKNFAIEGRIKKGIVDVLDSGYYSSNSTYYNSDYNTNFLFQLGVSYTFDIK
ncbi:outer membrane beta-barrel protein [Flavobacterium sp.]|uniref:outer membrane beta-barrel protein n=1 Tax=Flavobacterium sp. TaxID=239 RepID=UPI002B4B9045|nr:outer membrane beta-barrel protein [Flavobacterium sp.]HLF51073.1 outer membrane beta-barrel protein [Flavobacterium sp.]